MNLMVDERVRERGGSDQMKLHCVLFTFYRGRIWPELWNCGKMWDSNLFQDFLLAFSILYDERFLILPKQSPSVTTTLNW